MAVALDKTTQKECIKVLVHSSAYIKTAQYYALRCSVLCRYVTLYAKGNYIYH